MELLKCPKCGELFADSYKECPFCQEDEAYLSADKNVKKGPGRRVEKTKSPSILGPALIVVLVLLVGFLVYTFLGDKIADMFTGTDKPGVEDQVNEPDTPTELTLNKTELKLTVGDNTKLVVSVKDGCQWTSSNVDVATVDENGKITAIAAGEATITAMTDSASVACVVTVVDKDEPAPEPEPEPEPDPDPAEKNDLKLVANVNPDLPQGDGEYDYDFGMGVGDEFMLDVEGTDSAITWKSSNTSKVKISDDGTIKRVADGEVTITATVDGQTIKALVR